MTERVALNFTKRERFTGKPVKENMAFKGSSRDPSVSLPGFEKKDINEIITIPDEDNSPSLYVVTFVPDGYVIVSATKKESPILGYSQNSVFDFDKLPYGLALWLVDRMDKIQILKYSESIKIADEIEKQWAQRAPDHGEETVVSGGSAHAQKGPLLTTLWGQKMSYNTLLTKIDGSSPPTGCVATAMAQVMKYHEFPTNYNWSAMPNRIGTNETAQLMKDIGEAVNMNYSLGASGARLEDARDALINRFGFSNTARYVDYNSNTVVSEIENNRPVFMEGYRTYYTTTSGWWIFKKTTHNYEKGHAWVCDGYRITSDLTIHNPETLYEYTTSTTNGYFLHMNWGWGGRRMGPSNNDGWFKHDNWRIYDDGDVEYNYQYQKKCIIGIKR